MQTEEQAILERITQSRAVPELTEQAEPTLELVDNEPEEVEQEAEASAEVEQPETEDQTGLEQDQANIQDDTEELYVAIGDREISLKDIKEWEQGSLRQSDYTRKTQALAEDRKQFEAKQASIDKKSEQLESNIAALEVLVDEFEQSDFDGYTLEELRDIDPDQYIKVTEKQDKRKKALNAAKSQKSSLSSEDLQAKQTSELSKLIKNNPHWISDGKETEAYKSDMTLITNYLVQSGVPENEQQGILVSGYGQAFIDAAKYRASEKSNSAIAKKVRLAPVVTKPGGASKSVSTTMLEKAKANHKKHGSVESATALRKAQKQFKGD